MRRRWLGRAALAGWLLLGGVAALLAPAPEPPSPEAAQLLFGAARSMESAAPAGLLALRRTLERLGMKTVAHNSVDAPSADVLVLLAPEVVLEPVEAEVLGRWIRGGGRLIYAPRPTPAAPAPDAHAPAAAASPDVLLAELSTLGPAERFAGAELRRGGAGAAAILDDGGLRLSNAALRDAGLAPELTWLAPLLLGTHTVAFDEGRIGQAAPAGLLSLLAASPLGPALGLALAAFALWILARGARRLPAHPEPPAGSRDFSEHLDALGALLARGDRELLARRELSAGTRRRLGTLATAEPAASLLNEAVSRAAGPARLARTAERLRKLEAG